MINGFAQSHVICSGWCEVNFQLGGFRLLGWRSSHIPRCLLKTRINVTAGVMQVERILQVKGKDVPLLDVLRLLLLPSP